MGRTINAIPESNPIDIYVNDMPFILNIEFRELTSYRPALPVIDNVKYYFSGNRDNILLENLKNVYWIGGDACGGKTTIAKELAARYDMEIYHCDYQYASHKGIANYSKQPAMCRHFENWDLFFDRPVAEYKEWINDSIDEEFGMFIVDILKLAHNKKVVVEGLFTPRHLSGITTYKRMVFLYANKDIIRRDYFERGDKLNMYNLIQRLQQPKSKIERTFEVVESSTYDSIKLSKEMGAKYFIRDINSTVEETFVNIIEHFGI